jgi:hypothetical protein
MAQRYDFLSSLNPGFVIPGHASKVVGVIGLGQPIVSEESIGNRGFPRQEQQLIQLHMAKRLFIDRPEPIDDFAIRSALQDSLDHRVRSNKSLKATLDVLNFQHITPAIDCLN